MATSVLEKKKWVLKGCSRCSGDLELIEGVEITEAYIEEIDEWKCLQCGRSKDNRGGDADAKGNSY